jgi:hypothetical protein
MYVYIYVSTSTDKILAFKRKLDLRKNHVVKGNLEMFPPLPGLESEEDIGKSRVLLKTISRNCGTNSLPFNTRV